MSFSHSSRLLGSGKTCNQNMHPKMSVSPENVANASEQSVAEDIKANKDRISPELIEEKIRVNLEPLSEEILKLY